MTRARKRANLFLRELLRLVDVLPFPHFVDFPQEGRFEMTWRDGVSYLNVASYNDGRFEFYVEEGEDENLIWEGETTLPVPPPEFVARFRPLCEDQYEKRLPEAI